MHKIHFFPLGNADSTLLEINSGATNEKLVLFDYANMRVETDKTDKRCDLPTLLRSILKAKKRTSFDVVAFSHLDDDHIHRAGEFFYFEHSTDLQDDSRFKIDEIWVPAAVLVEEECESDEEIIQEEARYRFKQGKGIRVFSQPKSLDDWMKKNGLTWESHGHLVTDAGKLVPNWDDRKAKGVEFFVHSPFGYRQDDNEVVVRNDDCLVMQATFFSKGYLSERDTRLILSADVTHEVMTDIVKMTRKRGREERLQWDVFKLPHHCSYLSLGPEKGENETEPDEDIKWWFEQGSQGAKIVSTSWTIPSEDTKQPPHRQTAATHRKHARNVSGDFMVTMENPSKSAPEPLVMKIDTGGVTVEKASTGGASSLLTVPPPRAGSGE